MYIKETFCLWCDLLGYGKPFIDSGWNLHDKRVIQNIDRINNLEIVFHNINNYPIEKTLIMNDGFIRNMDIVPIQDGMQQSYLYWFNFILYSFYTLNRIDKQYGFPGARGVLTYGHRFDYMNNQLTAADIVQTSKENIPKYEKEILVYSPKEFQMNTAFSKAYIMEGAGSRAGIVGSNLYIDIDFLERLRKILESGKCTYHLLIDEDAKRMREKGYDVDNKGRQIVYLSTDTFEEDEFSIWQVNQKTCGNEKILFKLWLNKKYIDFRDKGIDTKLFKVIKYKPFDEDNIIIEFD